MDAYAPLDWGAVSDTMRSGRLFGAVITAAQLAVARERLPPAAWLESELASPPEPFGLWAGMAARHPDGASLRFRLRSGPGPSDPQCPLVNDPRGVDASIAAWVTGNVTSTSVIVINAAERADGDSLRALGMVGRSLDRKPAALLLVVGGTGSSHWQHLLRTLAPDIGLLVGAGGVETTPAARPSGSVADAIDHYRHGAYEGATALLTALMVDCESAAGDRAAWLWLAKAMMHRERDFSLAAFAARRALALAGNGAEIRLARRILVLALNGHGGSEQNVKSLASEAERELDDPGLSDDERGWLLIDAAVGCRLDEDWERHMQFLNRALSLRGQLRAQPLAAAHAWRAGALVFGGRLAEAERDQSVATQLLEADGEISRPLLIRSRRGGVLAALGRHTEAAAELKAAADLGILTGDLRLAAVCLADAATQLARSGDPSGAADALSADTHLRRQLWTGAIGTLLRQAADGEIAVAQGRDVDALDVAGSVLSQSAGLVGPDLEWGARLSFQAQLLRAATAAARGDRNERCGALGIAARFARQVPVGERQLVVAELARLRSTG